MIDVIEFGGITAQVVRKSHQTCASECLPAHWGGAYFCATPRGVGIDSLVCGIALRLDTAQPKAIFGPRTETPREYLPRESHYVWGRRCLLSLAEKEAPPAVEWSRSSLKIITRSA